LPAKTAGLPVSSDQRVFFFGQGFDNTEMQRDIVQTGMFETRFHNRRERERVGEVYEKASNLPWYGPPGL
jgi:hypothetical protein